MFKCPGIQVSKCPGVQYPGVRVSECQSVQVSKWTRVFYSVAVAVPPETFQKMYCCILKTHRPRNLIEGTRFHTCGFDTTEISTNSSECIKASTGHGGNSEAKPWFLLDLSFSPDATPRKLHIEYYPQRLNTSRPDSILAAHGRLKCHIETSRPWQAYHDDLMSLRLIFPCLMTGSCSQASMICMPV